MTPLARLEEKGEMGARIEEPTRWAAIAVGPRHLRHPSTTRPSLRTPGSAALRWRSCMA
jgi:hypothetical protein